MKNLYIYRGLPGSGKSTAAGAAAIAADDFYVNKNGIYKFDPSKIAMAHADCQRRVLEAMERGEETIKVTNTFTRRWEALPYLDMAKRMGYNVVVIDLFDAGLTDQELFQRNVHQVPLQVIMDMRSRYEKDILGNSDN